MSTLTFAQDWDQDQLANWSNFNQDNDGNGTNDLSQGRTHNDANEITQIDSSATHTASDAAGNMSKVPKPESWSDHYDLTWDAWNRLVKVTNGANTIAEYQYDGGSRRIVKKIYNGGGLSETRHIFLSVWNQVLEERVNSLTTSDRQFTWGGRYIDDLVLRTRDTDASGSVDETVYALQDANWNITALTDTSGAVIERFVYTPYGQSIVLESNFTPDTDGVSDVDWEYRFTSREFDDETALHYFRARYYHDTLGRFIGRDPLGFVDGASFYQAYFVPSSCDPTGLSDKKGGGSSGGKKRGGGFGEGITDGFRDVKDWWEYELGIIRGMSPEECATWCDNWVSNQKKKSNDWIGKLPSCPCNKPADGITWMESKADKDYHKGCETCFRSGVFAKGWPSGQQCCYDKLGNLLTEGTGAGSVDSWNPFVNVVGHYLEDVKPFLICEKAGADYLKKYQDLRPANKGNKEKPCPDNPTPQ